MIIKEIESKFPKPTPIYTNTKPGPDAVTSQLSQTCEEQRIQPRASSSAH